MLSFGRVPVPYSAVPHRDAVGATAAAPLSKAPADVEEEEQSDVADRQYRSRYYAAVLPAAVPGLPRRSSHPSKGAAVPISSVGSVSRFARSSLSSAQSSHSLPTVLRRSQPIDIPTGRRSVLPGAAAAHWPRKVWQGAADETDSSGSSAGSGDSDCEEDAGGWCVGSQRQLSASFVDDTQLQWSGRCLDDDAADFTGFRMQHPHNDDEEPSVRSSKRLQRLRLCTADGNVAEKNDSDEDEADGALPFPLLAPSYHVDFELN